MDICVFAKTSYSGYLKSSWLQNLFSCRFDDLFSFIKICPVMKYFTTRQNINMQTQAITAGNIR